MTSYIRTYPEKFKWKIGSVVNKGLQVLMKVTFAYGWIEQTYQRMATPEQRDEEGNIIQEAVFEDVVQYMGNMVDEEIELPAMMTPEQVRDYLNAYWGDKYALLDRNSEILQALKQMAGTKEG